MARFLAGQPDYDYSDEVTTDSPNGQSTPVQIEVFTGPLLTVTVSASPTTVNAGASRDLQLRPSPAKATAPSLTAGTSTVAR